jgi:glycosyltransferase involved in cell wall biosynthesis
MSVFGKAGIAARVADFGLFYVLALWRLLTMERPDVVVCYTTPPFIGLAGIVCRWLRGSKTVYWVMDLYPDVAVACGVMREKGLATRFFERVNRFILRHSDVDVVLGRCMEERVIGKGTPRERVRMIPVWADLGGLGPVEHGVNPLRKVWAPGGEFVVMYSGNFGLGHDAQTIIGAMRALKDDAGIRFVFIGGGKRRKEVEAAVGEFGLKNVMFEEYRPREELSRSLSAGDVHLISLREGVEGIMVPSKMYGIMAVGRPSLFVGHPSSEISRVLEESGSGVTVREGDWAGLAARIIALRDDPARRLEMGERGRAAIAGRYDSTAACGAWVEMLEGLVGKGQEGKE